MHIEDEEPPQTDCLSDADEMMTGTTVEQEQQQQQLTHSSSTSDIAEQLYADQMQGNMKQKLSFKHFLPFFYFEGIH